MTFSCVLVDGHIWVIESSTLRCVFCLVGTAVVGVVCGALVMVASVGVRGVISTVEAACTQPSYVLSIGCEGEPLGLSALVEGGGVRVRATPMFAVAGPAKTGDGCSELLSSGVVDKKRARLGVGAGRNEEVSESRSLALCP